MIDYGGHVPEGAAGMTPEHRRTLIIETIHAVRIGAPISKGLVTILLEPWPDLLRRHDAGGRWLDQFAAGRRSDRARLGVTNAAPAACRAYNGIQHIPFPTIV
jgi:hypothetical protein